MNINEEQITAVDLPAGRYTIAMIEKLCSDMKEAELTSIYLFWEIIQKLGLKFEKFLNNESVTVWKNHRGQETGITLSLSDMNAALTELYNWVQKS